MTGAMMLPSVTQVSHHVWLNLETLKFYCLPDNYEIIDPSLEDIKVCLISFSSFLPFSPSSFFSLLLPLTSPPSLSLCHPPLLVFHLLPLHLPYNVHLSLSSFLLFPLCSTWYLQHSLRSMWCHCTSPGNSPLHWMEQSISPASWASTTSK